MNVIIIGCTKVGISLASELCRNGCKVAVIDENAKRFEDLPTFFSGVTVEGVAMDIDVLERAGISECEAFTAVTDDDNLNIVVAQLARDMYHIDNVVVRIMDPVREKVFENIGLKTICPTNIEGAGIYNILTGENYDSFVSLGSHKARFWTRYDPKWVGKRICDIPVFNGEMVYAVASPDGTITLALDRGGLVCANDRVIFTSLAD